MSGQLVIENVSKSYSATQILQSISLEVEKGDLVCLLGPSGSGKSTLLRCIAGLETVDQGAIHLEGRPITHTPPHLRGIGMMFQQFVLFPHRSVGDNITFGLKMRGDSQSSQQKRLAEMLELVGLAGFGKRSIFELSGGEQQRVALARSLAPSPNVLLLDEPMGSLDRTLRERLMREVRQIVKALNVTTLYVTHDQEEAFAVADQVVLLSQGRIVQEATPEHIYSYPANRFVASFFGLHNVLTVEGTPVKVGQHHYQVSTALDNFVMATPQLPNSYIVMRPEGATIASGDEENVLRGILRQKMFRGGHHQIIVDYQNGITLEWDLVDTDLPAIGDYISLAIKATAITFIDA